MQKYYIQLWYIHYYYLKYSFRWSLACKCFADHPYLCLFQCLDIQNMLYGPQHKKTKATHRTVDMLSQWVPLTL